jgi:NAD+ diphosphatase
MNSRERRLDRDAAKRHDLDFLEAQLGLAGTRFLPFWKGQPFAEAGALALIAQQSAATLLDAGGELVWLGRFEEQSLFAVDITPLAEPRSLAALSGGEPSDLRTLVSQLDGAHAELALYGRAMLTWHERHRFCAVCGQPSKPRHGGHMRLCTSSSCGAQHFPRTDPCVLMLVIDGEDCLLARSPNWPAGMHSALAGFVEPGENLEDAAAREVFEEAGIAIADVRYVSSQPWPYPASLMIGFVARALSRELKLDKTELAEARWVSRGELASLIRARDSAGSPPAGFFVPRAGALAGQLIAAFARGEL